MKENLKKKIFNNIENIGRKYNSYQKWNKGKCQFESKNSIKHRVCKEHYVSNPSVSACETNKYLKSIVNDLVLTCDELIKV